MIRKLICYFPYQYLCTQKYIRSSVLGEKWVFIARGWYIGDCLRCFRISHTEGEHGPNRWTGGRGVTPRSPTQTRQPECCKFAFRSQSRFSCGVKFTAVKKFPDICDGWNDYFCDGHSPGRAGPEVTGDVSSIGAENGKTIRDKWMADDKLPIIAVGP